MKDYSSLRIGFLIGLHYIEADRSVSEHLTLFVLTPCCNPGSHTHKNLGGSPILLNLLEQKKLIVCIQYIFHTVMKKYVTGK